MADRLPKYEKRDLETLREQYEIEKKMAGRIMACDPGTRQEIYRTVYRELFSKKKSNAPEAATETQKELVAEKAAYIGAFARSDSSIIEYGAWDLSLYQTLKTRFAAYKMVDFFGIIDPVPDGIFLPVRGLGAAVPDDYAAIVFEYVVFHLLHPHDAPAHAAELFRMLKRGGRYISVISNSSIGPSDVSRYFTSGPPEGLHLREYTHREVAVLFKKAGFRKCGVLIKAGGRWIEVPVFFHVLLDGLFSLIPKPLRDEIKQISRIRTLFTIRFVATK